MSARRRTPLIMIFVALGVFLLGVGGLAVAIVRLAIGEAISLGPRGVGRNFNGELRLVEVIRSTYEGYARRDVNIGGTSNLLRTEWDLDRDGEFDCAEHRCQPEGICVSRRDAGAKWVLEPNVEDCLTGTPSHPRDVVQDFYKKGAI